MERKPSRVAKGTGHGSCPSEISGPPDGCATQRPEDGPPRHHTEYATSLGIVVSVVSLQVLAGNTELVPLPW